MHWLDIVIIALIALFAIIGLFKGFFNGIISICSIFVSLIISIYTANWFAGIIRSLVDIDGWFDHFLQDTLNVGDSLVVFGASYPREKVAAFLTVLLAGILIFIFIRCVVALLTNLFKSITQKSKTIGGLNRILGFVLGAVKGGLLVAVALAVCSIVGSLGLPGLSDTINTTIGETKVTSFAYQYVDEFVDAKMDGKSFEEIISGIFDEETAKEQDNNTTLQVVYENGTSSYNFILGQTVDYSSIIVVYNAGEGSSPELVPLTKSNFSADIDTTTAKTNAKVTITAYGKTVELTYNVVAGN